MSSSSDYVVENDGGELLTVDSPDPLRLDLGAGLEPVDGFISVDRKNGHEVYPLNVPDDSVDEIRASHVLEHFSHTQVMEVVQHWVSKLKPGGRLRIAVPDFEWISREYLAGKPVNVQGYLMGGHVDENDHHGCAFDAEVLEELLLDCGLERLHPWESERNDCAALPVSLNRGAFKPSGDARRCEGVTAVLSAPRFGPVAHFRFANRAFALAGVPYQQAGGAYWHQVMCELMEEHIALPDTRYVVTVDYDSMFDASDVLELYRLAESMPDADAICALESKRGSDAALFGIRDRAGNHVNSVANFQLARNLLPITTGHFGLTIFRADALRELPRPWMVPQPNKDGRWTDGREDADMNFWLRWQDAGKKLYLAPRVVIGHMQEMIAWPGKNLKPVYQTLAEYDDAGKPSEVMR